LQRAFLKTYGIRLEDVFADLDLSIGSFRWAVGRAIPQMTKVAVETKKDEMVKENPSFAKNKFLYNLSRSEYEKEWGKQYQRPGFGTRFLAAIFRIIPKVGPFKAVAFKMPYPDTETAYLKSVNDTVDRYRACLRTLKNKDDLALVNSDFDTGKLTRSGEYTLADETYARLLDKLADSNFSNTSADLRKNILAFYQDLNAPNATKKKPDRWNKTMAQLEQLKATQVAVSHY